VQTAVRKKEKEQPELRIQEGFERLPQSEMPHARDSSPSPEDCIQQCLDTFFIVTMEGEYICH
jgi:hypothetical protein